MTKKHEELFTHRNGQCGPDAPCHSPVSKTSEVCGVKDENTMYPWKYCQRKKPCPDHCLQEFYAKEVARTINEGRNEEATQSGGWEEIKAQYSQSGLFDLAPDLEDSLDKDVAALLARSKEEGRREELEWVLEQFPRLHKWFKGYNASRQRIEDRLQALKVDLKEGTI